MARSGEQRLPCVITPDAGPDFNIMKSADVSLKSRRYKCNLMDRLFLLHGTKSICQGSKGMTQQRTVTHQTELDI
jgi:hypothetical protein